jgi:LuxR family transcriptional regulator, maltose regulon positive regulatory protein
MLESLACASGFLVPLDDDARWYRHHHMFRELLADELEHREPGAISALNRRAAAWSEQNDASQAAVEYALQAGDLEHAARLLTAYGLEIYQSGQLERLRGWVDRLDQPAVLERHPEIAILGAWAHGPLGPPGPGRTLGEHGRADRQRGSAARSHEHRAA